MGQKPIRHAVSIRRTIISLSLALTVSIAVSGCTNTGHMPPIWSLPGAAIGTAIENAHYDARRKKVSVFIRTHYTALATEISQQERKTYGKLCAVAQVENDNMETLYNELSARHTEYFLPLTQGGDTAVEPTSSASNTSALDASIERITIAVMVHSN